MACSVTNLGVVVVSTPNAEESQLLWACQAMAWHVESRRCCVVFESTLFATHAQAPQAAPLTVTVRRTASGLTT